MTCIFLAEPPPRRSSRSIASSSSASVRLCASIVGVTAVDDPRVRVFSVTSAHKRRKTSSKCTRRVDAARDAFESRARRRLARRGQIAVSTLIATGVVSRKSRV